MEAGLLNHKWLLKQAEITKSGIDFPFCSVNGILLTNTDKERLQIIKNKQRVLDFILENKRVYLSEISEKLNLDLVDTKQIINELKKEGKIKTNE